jgi:hypothetical protein
MNRANRCEVPVDVCRRLRLLYLVAQFSDACNGKVRLHKVAYFSEKQQATRLFTFQKAPWGPFSDAVEETLEQLLSMGLVTAEPMGARGGNKYRVARPGGVALPLPDWVRAMAEPEKRLIASAVETYGYMSQQELIAAGHREPGFERAQHFDVLLDATVTESGLVPVSLPEADCEDLVLALSPGFVATLRGLSEVVRDFDFARVPAGCDSTG